MNRNKQTPESKGKFIEPAYSPYRKKKYRIAKPKSDHKHIYDGLCYIFNKTGSGISFWSVRHYCTVCGKLGEEENIFYQKTINGQTCFAVASFDDYLEKYGELPVFIVEPFKTDKYVDIHHLNFELPEKYRKKDE